MVHIERIVHSHRRYLQTMEYMDWFNPAWQALTEDERWVPETHFLEGEEVTITDADVLICEHSSI